MRSLAPTRPAQPPSTFVIVYDGNCRFCTRIAAWAASRARVPVTTVAFDAMPREAWLTSLSEGDVLRQAHLITPGGVEYHGGAAATAALRLTRFAVVGKILDLPLMNIARDAGYALTVRSRRLLSSVIDWWPA